MSRRKRRLPLRPAWTLEWDGGEGSVGGVRDDGGREDADFGEFGREAWGEDAGSPYARALHRAACARDLTDRLLVAALVEARSCERLARLGEAFAGEDAGRLWASLAHSEAGHFRLFLRLAARATPVRQRREGRLRELSACEAEVCAATVGGARVL